MAKKSEILNRLKEHFDSDPAELPVLELKYASYQQANLHLALEELFETLDISPTLSGIVIPYEHESASLSKLSKPKTAAKYDIGPVEYLDVDLPKQKRLSCVKRGLYLFRDDENPIVLLLEHEDYGAQSGIVVEFMASTKERAEEFADRLKKLVSYGKAYRGHVLSFERDCYGGTNVKFHQLTQVKREEIILPEEILQRIERHTIAFSMHSERLVKAGRHLKRGILLHGPPGTGKTFTAMYLASRMVGRTVFLLTGAGMGSIEMACGMARLLAPATVILEDVDLIGTQRDRQMVDANALLFELLNQMDGLADDADILFLLTTNRPDVLEPALAARPGRIDQAIEIPLPDKECRRRLFELYSKGLTIEIDRLDESIRKMEGVSSAFVRELLRKAAVYAAIESEGELVVRDRHLSEAMEELVVAGGTLTQSLLGAQPKTDA